MNNNDERILQLKERIAAQEEKIREENIVFNPTTNCILEIDGTTYNLNALGKVQLVFLLDKLDSANNTWVTYIGNNTDFILSGFHICDWIDDIIKKIRTIDNVHALKQIKDAQKKLDSMLSDQKKTEMSIDEIESLFNLS